jgi:DNA-binding IclR family transcriptional regulator
LLEVLAREPAGLTVSELAGRLGMHRAGVYRLLATLDGHRLVRRVRGGGYVLGLGLVELAGAVARDLRSVAEPEVAALAEEVGATAALTVMDGQEAVAVLVVEPRNQRMHVAYRVGSRHPVDRGASGIAILSGRPPQPGERPEVTLARHRDYAVTRGELQPGAFGIAAAIKPQARPAEASIGIVGMGDLDEEVLAPRVMNAALSIGRAL